MRTYTFVPNETNKETIKQQVNEFIDNLRDSIMKNIDIDQPVSVHQQMVTDMDPSLGYEVHRPVSLLGCTLGISIGQYATDK
jgi:hypothetical protein